MKVDTHINFHLYHYAGNNPVRYTDPDGRNAVYTIDDENNTIIIEVNINIFGDGANESVASIYEFGINLFWNDNFTASIGDKEYKVVVKSSVSVTEIPINENYNANINYIEVRNDISNSFVKDSWYGVWRAKGRDGKNLLYDNPAVHEVGHLLGLKDRYDLDSQQVYPGWEGNIMACDGSPEQRNIDGIMKLIKNPEIIKKGVIVPNGGKY